MSHSSAIQRGTLAGALCLSAIGLSACSVGTVESTASRQAQAAPAGAQQATCPRPFGAADSAPQANFRPSAPRNVRVQALGGPRSVWHQVSWEPPATSGPYGIIDFVVTGRDLETGILDVQVLDVRDQTLRPSYSSPLAISQPDHPYEVTVMACDAWGAGTSSAPVPITGD